MEENESSTRQALQQLAETRRILCAAEHAFRDAMPAVLIVTSATRGEGKSLFSAALASAAVDLRDYRLLLIDLNWYSPSVHRFFDVDCRQSFDRILKADLNDIVCSSGERSLDLVTAPVDYAERARAGAVESAAPAVQRLVAEAKNTYDLVVIDSAAVFPTNRMMIDPVVLSGLADGVALVVRSEVTPRQMVRRAQKVMESAGAPMLGVVANQGRLS